jgi:BirA family transcriptional regulator, biotin operon repressor / biotin---[acetyl-CoA-carboxylase] ligase
VTIDGDIWCSTSWPAGWDVRHVDETGSTNADLIAAVASGAAGDRTVLVADHQTAGRGRLDRRWEAPPGANLLVSMVVAPIPAIPAEATQRVGLAAAAAVRRFVDPDVAPAVGLKWPNDVLVGDRKLAGILAQRVPDHDAVVVGLGLNVGWAPDGAAAVGPLAAGANAGQGVDPVRLLRALLEELDALPTDIGSRYVESLVTVGRWVRVELPGGAEPLSGRAIGIDEAGRLIVTDATGLVHALDVGDVVHVRALDGENLV